MRIAIVDDSTEDQAQLASCLTRYFANAGAAYETTFFSDAQAFLKDYVK